MFCLVTYILTQLISYELFCVALVMINYRIKKRGHCPLLIFSLFQWSVIFCQCVSQVYEQFVVFFDCAVVFVVWKYVVFFVIFCEGFYDAFSLFVDKWFVDVKSRYQYYLCGVIVFGNCVVSSDCSQFVD